MWFFVIQPELRCQELGTTPDTWHTSSLILRSPHHLDHCPILQVQSLKKVHNEGLHTRLKWAQYCRKDCWEKSWSLLRDRTKMTWPIRVLQSLAKWLFDWSRISVNGVQEPVFLVNILRHSETCQCINHLEVSLKQVVGPQPRFQIE